MHNLCFCLRRVKIHTSSIAEQVTNSFYSSRALGRLNKYLHSKCILTSDRFFSLKKKKKIGSVSWVFWQICYLEREWKNVSFNSFCQITLLVCLSLIRFCLILHCTNCMGICSIFSWRKHNLATIFEVRFWIRVGVDVGRVVSSKGRC